MKKEIHRFSDPESNFTGHSAGHLSSYLRLLKTNVNYRRFWFSGVISQAGDWFNYIAIFVLLSSLTGSGRAVSWFLIAKFLPTAVLGPLAGVIADRFSRKTILISCDLVRALIVLGYLFVREVEHVWLIYLLAFVQESIWTFAHPARQASVPNLCSREELSTANGLSGSSWSIMLAIGAALGGFVSAAFGWQTAILVDSLTFVVSAVIMTFVGLPSTVKRRETDFSLARITGWSGLVEGAIYVRTAKNEAITR